MALSGPQYGKSLAAKLARVADTIRPLNDKFGLRPYTVRIVTLQWTGFRVGNGTPVVVSELTLDPSPAIPRLRLGVSFKDFDNEEEHDLEVSEISIKYTPEQLMGIGPDGALPVQTEVFYEIEKFRLDGGPSDKRRYEVVSSPVWVPNSLGWAITLRRARGDRARSGSPHS